MKRALVCGAGGFIGVHPVKRLKHEGYWVRGVDIKQHDVAQTEADEFLLLDLRQPHNGWRALTHGACHSDRNGVKRSGVEESRPEPVAGFDEVYQLAADVGHASIPANPSTGNVGRVSIPADPSSADMGGLGFIHTAARMDVPRYVFSSSVYRDTQPGEPALDEDDAYPALPDNEKH